MKFELPPLAKQDPKEVIARHLKSDIAYIEQQGYEILRIRFSVQAQKYLPFEWITTDNITHLVLRLEGMPDYRIDPNWIEAVPLDVKYDFVIKPREDTIVTSARTFSPGMWK